MIYMSKLADTFGFRISDEGRAKLKTIASRLGPYADQAKVVRDIIDRIHMMDKEEFRIWMEPVLNREQTSTGAEAVRRANEKVPPGRRRAIRPNDRSKAS